LRAAEPIRKDDLGNSFSQRYINGYRTGYFLDGVAARRDAAIQTTADGVAAVITG
jgi:hypothetical protein